MFDIIHKKRPQAGENTNERFPSDMLSRDPHVCTSTKFALVRDQIVLLKYQISGLGVSHTSKCCKKNSRKRESQSTLSHTNARAEGRRERKSSGFNHEEVQREFVSKLTRCSKLRFVKEWCYYLRREREKTQLCFPVRDNLFPDWGFVFFFVSFFVCALFRSRLFAFACKQRK